MPSTSRHEKLSDLLSSILKESQQDETTTARGTVAPGVKVVKQTLSGPRQWLSDLWALLGTVFTGVTAVSALVVVLMTSAQSVSVPLPVKRHFINYLLLFSVFEARASAASLTTRLGKEGSGGGRKGLSGGAGGGLMEGGQKALSGGAKGKSQGGMEGGLVEGGAMPAAGSLDHRRLTTVDGWQSYTL